METDSSSALLKNKPMCQVGIVVRDITKSAQAYAKLFGVDMPSIVVTDEYEKAHTLYNGQPSKARAKLAFFDAGSLQLELIEPIDGPSTWKDFLR